MRVAVYDEHWPTAGGGEKVAAAMARALAGDHDVTILAHEALDLAVLGERLQLDLDGIGVSRIDLAPTSVEEASRSFDVLVNASYHSSAVCGAPHGVYYVHFPHPPMRESGGIRGFVARTLRPIIRIPGVEVELVRGFHDEEILSGQRARWTDGAAELAIRLPPERELPLRLDLGRLQPHEMGSIPTTVGVDGEVAARVELAPRTSRFQSRIESVVLPVSGHADGSPLRVRLESPTVVPSRDLGTDDRRRLGVPFVGVQVGEAIRARLARRYPSLVRTPDPMDWIHSYSKVVANSRYTAGWVDRWWGVEAEVLSPPVTMQGRREKRHMILAVGRFFDSESGHSKKQLELVHAFRRLLERGVQGWELHLVGGCSTRDRAYLERVRFAAGDAPVELHVNASGAELRELYSSAAIYWHASGLGEDPERHPDRLEHFGITTVEAMSAGAVPIVIGLAGQQEVVAHGRTGFLFSTVGELVELTELVIADERLRQRLGEAASAAATAYGAEVFDERVRGLVEGLLRSGPAAAGASR